MVVVQSPASTPVKSTAPPEWPISEPERQPLISPPPYDPESTFVPKKLPDTARRRFWKALGITLLIVLFTAVIVGFMHGDGVIVDNPNSEPQKSDGDIVACHLPWMGSDKRYPMGVSSSKTPDHTWPTLAFPDEPSYYISDPPYADGTLLTLTLDQTRLLFFLSRGSLLGGTIRFVHGNRSHPTWNPNQVTVDIGLRFWNLKAKNKVNVCLLRRKEGALGVGIYTPSQWPTNEIDKVSVYVTVALPTTLGEQLTMGALQTNMPRFGHEFDDFSQSVYFESVDLAFRDQPMRIKSMTAKDFVTKANNAPIRGAINVTHSLTLTTSNAPVMIKVGATNLDWHKPTVVDLKTSNALLDAELYLSPPDGAVVFGRAPGHGGWAGKWASSWFRSLFCKLGWLPACLAREPVIPPEGAGGFDITTTTINGPLKANIAKAPLGAHVKYSGQTSSGSARLTLPPSYEGSIQASTSNSRATWTDMEKSEDPSGQDRDRVVLFESVSAKAFKCNIWWGSRRLPDPSDLPGEVKIATRNGLVDVTLGP